MISQNTLASRTARAINCVNWLPKSRMSIFSVMDAKVAENLMGLVYPKKGNWMNLFFGCAFS